MTSQTIFYRFAPNCLGRKLFDLKPRFYENSSLTLLLENCMGEQNYRKFMVAQDPFANGRRAASIVIVTNPEEKDSARWNFEAIGIAYLIIQSELI